MNQYRPPTLADRRNRQKNTSERLLKGATCIVNELRSNHEITAEEKELMISKLTAWCNVIIERAFQPVPDCFFSTTMKVRSAAQWVETLLMEVRVRRVVKELLPQWEQQLIKEGVAAENLEERVSTSWWTFDPNQAEAVSFANISQVVQVAVEAIPRFTTKDEKPVSVKGERGDQSMISETGKWREALSELLPNEPLHPRVITMKPMEVKTFNGQTTARLQYMNRIQSLAVNQSKPAALSIKRKNSSKQPISTIRLFGDGESSRSARGTKKITRLDQPAFEQRPMISMMDLKLNQRGGPEEKKLLTQHPFSSASSSAL
jgi:hypothetical protein